MAQDSELAYLKSLNKNRSVDALPKPLPAIRELAFEALGAFLGNAFDGVDDSLFERADMAHSNNEQTYYFDSMREVRIKRRFIEETFNNNLTRYFVGLFDEPKESKEEEKASNYDSLSLVQDDALEIEVAITSMVTKIRGSCTAELFSLTNRMEALLKHLVDYRNNPLDPQQICDSFVDALSLTDVDVECKLLILKQFDKNVIRRLPELYHEVEQIFIAAGVNPEKLKKTIKKGRTAEKPRKDKAKSEELDPSTQDNPFDFNNTGMTVEEISSAPMHGGTSEASDIDLVASQLLDQWLGRSDYQSPYIKANDELFGFLEGLMISQPQKSIPITSSNPSSGSRPARIVRRDELLNLLDQIQNNHLDNSSDFITTEAIRNSLSQLLNQFANDERQAQVATVDEDVINLVSLFFDFILDDPNLPTVVQALIGRLQIPVLRLAIKDRAFFNKPGHPARMLLNELARAGVGLEEDAKEKKDVVYMKISGIVQRILKEFDGSVGLFEDLYHDFRSFIVKEAKRASRVEERTKEVARGKAKMDHAKVLVNKMIDERLLGDHVPPFIREFLQNTWQQVLLRIGLTKGPESEDWREFIEAMDGLVWVLVPRRDRGSRQRWAKIMPSVFSNLRKGMLEIDVNPFDQQKFFSELETTLHAQLRNSLHNEELGQDNIPTLMSRVDVPEENEVESESDTVGELVVFEAENEGTEEELDLFIALESNPHNMAKVKPKGHKTAVELQHEKELEALKRYLKEADSIPVGSWLEFTPVTGARLRCKLVEKINETQTFVFVNRLGQKVLEQQRKLIAQELKKGRVKIIDNRPLFDRALDAVVGKLRLSRQESVDASPA